MLCDICKKNEAVIHIQEISAAGKKIINLCNECAAKQQQGMDPLQQFGLNFNDVLENIKKISADLAKNKSVAENSPVCPRCGWDLRKMDENNGLLGCADCYGTFKSVIQKAVADIHRSHVHTGKRPGKNKTEPPEIFRMKLQKLENELQAAIQFEDYERAAVIRDEIASIRKNRAGDNGK